MGAVRKLGEYLFMKTEALSSQDGRSLYIETRNWSEEGMGVVTNQSKRLDHFPQICDPDVKSNPLTLMRPGLGFGSDREKIRLQGNRYDVGWGHDV